MLQAVSWASYSISSLSEPQVNQCKFLFVLPSVTLQKRETRWPTFASRKANKRRRTFIDPELLSTTLNKQRTYLISDNLHKAGGRKKLLTGQVLSNLSRNPNFPFPLRLHIVCNQCQRCFLYLGNPGCQKMPGGDRNHCSWLDSGDKPGLGWSSWKYLGLSLGFSQQSKDCDGISAKS